MYLPIQKAVYYKRMINAKRFGGAFPPRRFLFSVFKAVNEQNNLFNQSELKFKCFFCRVVLNSTSGDGASPDMKMHFSSLRLSATFIG